MENLLDIHYNVKLNHLISTGYNGKLSANEYNRKLTRLLVSEYDDNLIHLFAIFVAEQRMAKGS